MAADLGITPLRLGPDDAGRRVSAEEFRSADYEEGFIYERVRGLPGLSVPMRDVFSEFPS